MLMRKRLLRDYPKPMDAFGKLAELTYKNTRLCRMLTLKGA